MDQSLFGHFELGRNPEPGMIPHQTTRLMNPLEQHQQHLNRRHFFGRSATGIGTAALASLLQRDGFATEGVTTGGGGARGEATGSESPRIGGLPDLPHFAPKAKRVIYLFQNGAPTHVDLFDWKPNLKKKALRTCS